MDARDDIAPSSQRQAFTDGKRFHSSAKPLYGFHSVPDELAWEYYYSVVVNSPLGFLCEVSMTDDIDAPAGPRFAFLGFCDRAETITSGHHAFWHYNIMGLSSSRVFNILPVNLRGQKMLTAIFQPQRGDKFKLRFRCETVKREFEIVFEIAAIHHSERSDSSSPVRDIAIDRHDEGWVLQVNELAADVFVYERGVYKVYLSLGSTEVKLGEVSILNVELPPFGADDVAAIKSNPLSKKFVRIEFKCKQCGKSFRAYAGLERSKRLEDEGWIWSFDISDDRFECGCGAQDFSLAPIKKGLHGILRESFQTQSEGSAGSIFYSVRLYENAALQQQCRDFKELIDSSPEEEKVQEFLKGNEIFFSVFTPQKLFLKPPVLTKHFCDFAILNERKELLLIEIERPGLPLLRKDGVITADLQHAFSQVQDWFRVFDDHRAAALHQWDLSLNDVATVRGVVIAGRTPSDEELNRRLRSQKPGNIDFYTHDDLLNTVTGLIRHVANV